VRVFAQITHRPSSSQVPAPLGATRRCCWSIR
jgi:hypothetical protein